MCTSWTKRLNLSLKNNDEDSLRELFVELKKFRSGDFKFVRRALFKVCKLDWTASVVLDVLDPNEHDEDYCSTYSHVDHSMNPVIHAIKHGCVSYVRVFMDTYSRVSTFDPAHRFYIVPPATPPVSALVVAAKQDNYDVFELVCQFFRDKPEIIEHAETSLDDVCRSAIFAIIERRDNGKFITSEWVNTLLYTVGPSIGCLEYTHYNHVDHMSPLIHCICTCNTDTINEVVEYFARGPSYDGAQYRLVGNAVDVARIFEQMSIYPQQFITKTLGMNRHERQRFHEIFGLVTSNNENIMHFLWDEEHTTPSSFLVTPLHVPVDGNVCSSIVRELLCCIPTKVLTCVDRTGKGALNVFLDTERPEGREFILDVYWDVTRNTVSTNRKVPQVSLMCSLVKSVCDYISIYARRYHVPSRIPYYTTLLKCLLSNEGYTNVFCKFPTVVCTGYHKVLNLFWQYGTTNAEVKNFCLTFIRSIPYEERNALIGEVTAKQFLSDAGVLSEVELEELFPTMVKGAQC